MTQNQNPKRYYLRSLGAFGGPWKDHDSYAHNEAADKAEVVVRINSKRELAKLLEGAGLWFDKRSKNRGLAVSKDMPALNSDSMPLLNGDQLHPQASLPDVHKYATMKVPTVVKFWRPSLTTLVHHRCPLFDAFLGISIACNWAVDFLHTVSLGVVGFICCAVFWRVLDSELYCKASDRDTTNKQSLAKLQSKLASFYERKRKSGHRTSEVFYLTLGMFGSRKLHGLKTKGGQAMGLFSFFVEDVLPETANSLQHGPQLKACADALRSELPQRGDLKRD